jgi:hypothetical protein
MLCRLGVNENVFAKARGRSNRDKLYTRTRIEKPKPRGSAKLITATQTSPVPLTDLNLKSGALQTIRTRTLR